MALTITVDDVAGGFQWQTAVFFDLRAYLGGDAPVLVEGTFQIVCDF